MEEVTEQGQYYFPYSCRYFFIAYRHLQNQMKRLGKVSINNPPSSLAGLVDMELQENKQSRHVPFWYNCQGENLFGSATCWLFIFNSICPKVTSFMANGRAVLPSPFWQVSIEDTTRFLVPRASLVAASRFIMFMHR